MYADQLTDLNTVDACNRDRLKRHNRDLVIHLKNILTIMGKTHSIFFVIAKGQLCIKVQDNLHLQVTLASLICTSV